VREDSFRCAGKDAKFIQAGTDSGRRTTLCLNFLDSELTKYITNDQQRSNFQEDQGFKKHGTISSAIQSQINSISLLCSCAKLLNENTRGREKFMEG
jgi:hypothetical protein